MATRIKESFRFESDLWKRRKKKKEREKARIEWDTS